MDYVTIIGLTAAVCTTTSFLPQAIKTIQTKHTKDISLPMYIILNVGVLFWLIYGLLITDWPVIIANAITIIFTSTTLFMIIKYR